ncbi:MULTISPECIES: PucR family transcriptional regulator [unclassified Amycolatopsis]|uniref:PucR family transcriptional regulator n=1 Tax=unclassified Amycolatopsis TaxID=2618356 RepID=UPI002E108B7A|nr:MULTISPECIES: helix-turn-helix domain-containing protein [unclassified Amycolatopsis]WSK83592.1 helix-turn-helix domain-containing protein [Amycolatopsis sp. NBC_01286]
MTDVRADDGDTARSLAASVLGGLDELTDGLVSVIGDQNPGYRLVDVVPRDDLWHSCHDNLRRVLQLIGHAGDAEDFYDAARATGRRRAEQQLPLDDVLRSFRLGGRLVWQALTDQARATGEVNNEAMLDLATRVWEVVDAISAQVAQAYHATERGMVRADEQRRASLWEGLLQGRAADTGFAYEAARTLRLPISGRYVVVAAAGPGDADADFAEPLGSALEDLGSPSAWQSRADVLVGLVALPGRDVAGVVAAVGSVLAVPAGVSLVVDGLAAVHAAYRQAVLAMRTVPPGRSEVVCLAERLPEALLLSSPELTESLQQNWLRGLLDLGGDERELLLETLSTWVGTGGSATRSAQILHCHRNTVLNRIHRIEGLIEQRLTGGDLSLELALVVRALPFLPPPRVP